MPYSGRQKSFKLGKESFVLTRPNHKEMVDVAADVEERGEAVATALLIAASTEPEKLAVALETADHEDVSKVYDGWYEFVGVDPFTQRLEAARLKADERMFNLLKTQGVVQGSFQGYQKTRLGLTSYGSTPDTADGPSET